MHNRIGRDVFSEIMHPAVRAHLSGSVLKTCKKNLIKADWAASTWSRSYISSDYVTH